MMDLGYEFKMQNRCFAIFLIIILIIAFICDEIPIDEKVELQEKRIENLEMELKLIKNKFEEVK